MEEDIIIIKGIECAIYMDVKITKNAFGLSGNVPGAKAIEK